MTMETTMTTDQKIEKAAAILDGLYDRLMGLKWTHFGERLPRSATKAKWFTRAMDEVHAVLDGDEDAADAAKVLAEQRARQRYGTQRAA
jgi:hypothetical protein